MYQDRNASGQHIFVCKVFEGLCNRLNGIASAIATGRPIRLHWAINAHCPARFGDVFDPIAGVDIVEENVSQYSYEVSPDKLCWFYPKNTQKLPRDRFRRRLCDAYREILDCMKHKNGVKPPASSIGVHFRFHLGDVGRFPSFVEALEKTFDELHPQHVAVACDSEAHKHKLKSLIQEHGLSYWVNHCRLLRHDLDRTAENVRGMCRDLHSLAACNLGVITNSTRCTVVDSLRGVGVRAFNTFDDGVHRYNGRDDLFESQVISNLL